jgi:hypothetical protein
MPELPDWQQALPKLPDLKRFQRTFQGPMGKAQGMWGKFAKYNSNMWQPTGAFNGNPKKETNNSGKKGLSPKG